MFSCFKLIFNYFNYNNKISNDDIISPLTKKK